MNLSKFIVACAGIALLLLSNYSFSAQCSAIFPDVIATHGNGVGNSQINFGFNARLINNPDTELSTRRVSHNSGSNINTCGGANCTASNTSAETTSISFVRGGGTIDVNPGFNQTITFGTTSVNNYDQVNASSQATLNFSTGHNVYYFERLALGSDNVLNLLAGKTYYFRQFSVGSNTRVNVVGSGTAIVYVDSGVSFLSSSKINSPGVNQSGDASNLVMHVNGNVTLNSQSTYSGALYANDIDFNSPSYLFGVASGRRVNLNSNAILTYDNNVFNADFGEVCDSAINQATPIANFKFDETEYGDVSGEVIDSIGTFHSRAKLAQPVDGKVCRALDLTTTGTSDYVVLNEGLLDNKREFSVSLWAKTAKTSNQSFLSGATSGSFNELIMWFPQHRQFTPYLQNGSSGSLTTSSIAGDTWRHIVWTHGNNQSCLFIDKVSQGCVNQTTSTLDIQSLILGQEQDNVGGGFSSSQAFDGLIDELVVFDEIIQPGQIEQIYDYQNQGLGLNGETIACPAIPPPAFVAPIANFKFDEIEYADVDGEVIDSVGTFHSRAKASQPIDGKVCRAIDLSATGTSDYVMLDKDVLSGKREFSVSVWAKTAKTSNQSILSGAVNRSNNELIMWFPRDTRFTPFLQNRQNGTLTVDSIAGDTWQHVVWTHGKNKSCLFIDKVAQGCVNQTTSTLDIASLILGQEQDSVGGRFDSSQAFNGLLDELVIYDNVIGQAQIDQIYDYQNNGLGLDGQPLACDNEIIAQYSMEQNSWNNTVAEVIDETGNYNARAKNGAFTASSLPALVGNPGTCRYGTFDGNNDYVELPSNFENLQDSFTVTAWINPKNLDSGSRIFADDERNQGGYALSLSDQNNGNGHLRFYSRSVRPVSLDSPRNTISANTWHFVAMVHNKANKTRQIYAIEQSDTSSNYLRASGTYSGNWGTDSGPATIGGETDNGESNNRFAGNIDEVHVFKGALSAAEIEKVRKKTHPCAEPVIHHYEIVHDGNGLTCAAEPITIKACTNSDCSSLSTESVSLDFQVNGVTKAPVTFTGSTDLNNPTFSFNHTTAETVALSIANATVNASNVFECSGVGSNCDMTFDNAGFLLDINSGLNAMSCAETSFVIRAVKESDSGVSCAPAFTGSQSINFVFDRVSPTTQNASDKSTVPTLAGADMEPAGEITNRSITFDNNGEAVLPIQYNEAGQISLEVSEKTFSGVSATTLQKAFQPTYLKVSTLLTSSDHTGSVTKKAGENFEVNVTGHCSASAVALQNKHVINYQPQSSTAIELSVQQQAPTNSFGKLKTTNSDEINATDNSTISWAKINESNLTFNAKYSEVGIIGIAAQDTSYFDGEINYNESEQGYTTVGRFIPYEFKIDEDSFVDGILRNQNGSDFAYTGELQSTLATETVGAISYATDMQPEYSFSAINKAGGITGNYTGDFMMLDKSSFTIISPIKDLGRIDKAIDTDLTANLIIENNNITEENGVITFKFSNEINSRDNYAYTRNSASLISNYPASIALQVKSIIDGDLVNAVDPEPDELISPGLFTLNPSGVEIRFGRWNIESTYGPETSDLPLPMSVQYWDGNQFVINTLDNVTPYDGSDSDNYEKDNDGLSPKLNTGVVSVSDAGPSFSSGLGQLLLSKPSDGSQGQIRIIYSDVPSWLKFNWDTVDDGSDGNIFDDNPSGVATFGLYRGNDRIISWREVTN